MNILNLSNDILSNIIKYFVIHICTYFVFIKMINFKECTKITVIKVSILSLFLSISYEFLKLNLNQMYSFLLSCLTYSIFMKLIIKKRFIYSFLITLISFAISFIVFLFSAFIISCILIIVFNIYANTFIAFLSIDCLTILFTYLFLNIKKFKNGLYFLQNEEKIEDIGVFGISISIVAIVSFIIFGLFKKPGSDLLMNYTFLLFVTVSISMFTWIPKKLKSYYKNRMKDRTVELLEEEVHQAKQELETVLVENQKIAKENHTINHKLNTWQNISTKMLSNPIISEQFKLEFGEELTVFMEDINISSKEYISKIQNIENKKLLPVTNIFALDSIFESMELEATKNNISFEVKITGSIHYMIENFISENKLALLLSDHIKDAIIAVNASNNTYKNITVMLGILDNCYELRIYDSGIEFDINTLVNLGLKPVTTHADSGGTGFGFVTTFETLNETKASIIIKENKPSNTNYTKYISIRFDNKNEYRIHSYRANEISPLNTDKRILIDKS